MLRRTAVALALPFALSLLNAALAQTVLPVHASARLGDFLVAHRGQLAGQYDAALAWYAQAQLARQQQAKSILLQNIADLANFDRVHAKRYIGLFRLVRSMHATGRVVLPQTDPRYLQAHPRVTPLLAPGDRVLIPARPSTVAVVRSDGSVCPVRFAPGVDALVYLRACEPGASPGHVWVVQPTGRVQYSGSGAWNAQAQDPPAPGAWIWAPDTDSGWPTRISEQVAQFLATQPPLEQQHTIEAAARRPPAGNTQPASTATVQVASARPASPPQPAPRAIATPAPSAPQAPQARPHPVGAAPIVASAPPQKTQNVAPLTTPIPAVPSAPGIGPRNWTVAKAAGANAAPPAPPPPRTLTLA